MNPSKHSLLYLFQRRMICSTCAEKRKLQKPWHYASLGSIEGTCQLCGSEWRILMEVFCIR